MLAAEKILTFLSQLSLDAKLPKGVAVMNPYGDSEAWIICKQFYRQYFSDANSRIIILGINPGRFGGGISGIPFTDPIALEKECGIQNTLSKKRELSAEFIYKMINQYGGPAVFYQTFYISALSPLGFTSNGKNLNYYDHPTLQERVTPFIIETLNTQLGFGFRRDVCFCLGEGKNFTFLTRLNNEHQFFERIVPLAHPRFIMQYKRKQLDHYLSDYISKLKGMTR